MADFSYESDGVLTFSGIAQSGMKSVEYMSSGGMYLGASAVAEALISYEGEYLWNLGAGIEADFTFQWDLGKQALHYYTIQGDCQTPPTCDSTGVDPNDSKCSSGGMRFTQTIAASSLSDLCTKMKTLLINYPVNWPISKILRHSRPVYLSDVNFVSDSNTKISQLSDGTTITVITQANQTLIITRLPNGVTSSTTLPTVSGVVNDVLPDGTLVTTTVSNGKVSEVTITKPDGTVNIQRSNAILVVPTDSARISTVSSQLGSQLSSLPEACNQLEEQVYCHVPECLDFCISEYHVVNFKASSFIQNQFFNYEATGGFVLDGNVKPTSEQRVGDGGMILSGSSDITIQNVIYTPSGGFILSGITDISASNRTYSAESGLTLSGESSLVSPFYSYPTSGTLIFSGNSNSRQRNSFISQGGFKISDTASVTKFYIFSVEGDGGLTFGSSASVGSDAYTYSASGGVVFNGESSIKSPSWLYFPSSGLVLGGTPKIGFRYSMVGGTVFGGTTDSSQNNHYTPSSGFVFSGEASNSGSPSWYIPGTGGFILGGSAGCSYQNLGTYLSTFSSTVTLPLMEAVFGTSDANTVPLLADTGTVTTNCGCGALPIDLKCKHNFADTTVLKEFLFRNNFSLPSEIDLTYNKYDNLWRATYHYTGMGSDSSSSTEKWNVVFEWGCGYTVYETDDLIWRFSVLLTRVKNTSPVERYNTRILYSFKPADICNNNPLGFSFIVNTFTNELMSPSNITPVETILSDDIGLFDGQNWKKKNQLLITVSVVSTQSTTPVVDIYPLFPTS